MDNVSELLLGPQRSSGSTAGLVVAIVAVLLATALIGYFVWCYIRERKIRRRIQQRIKRPHGGNIAPAGEIPAGREREESTGPLPAAQNNNNPGKSRRRIHPWKRKDTETPTPH
jgi:hypothetical protein